MRLTDPPEVWAEHIVTVDDALAFGLWLTDCVHNVATLTALDDAMMILEARAQDPEPYTVARAGIALRLEELTP